MNTLIEALGWTLLHFLWQGSIAAVLLWGALRVLRSAAPHVRYLLAGVTLFLLLIGTAITGARQWENASHRLATSTPQGDRSSSTAVAINPPKSDIPSLTPSPPSTNPVIPIDEISVESPAIAPPSVPVSSPDLRQILRPWLPWIVALWAAGVTVLSIRFLRSWRALRQLRSHAKAPDDPAASTIFTRLIAKFHLRRNVVLLTTAEAVVPMVVGWLRPVIIVPASLLTHLPAWQVEAILAHELAHIRRHDYLVNLLQNLVETLFFYHPAVWWISAQLRKEREHCCDDAAVALCGGALDYAKALTALEEMRGLAPAGAVAVTGGSLLGRVRRLLAVPERHPETDFSWPVGIVITLLAIGLLASVHFVQGQEQNAENKLPDAPKQEMAGALLNRWQLLEEKESPLPESRVAGLRNVIAKWIKEEPTTANERDTLTRYESWHADRAQHDSDDLTRLLNAVAAVKPELIQLAFNHEPWLGRNDPQDAAKFGPAAANGLRASWSLSPNKDTYILGDVVYGNLILWNTGEETLMTGNGLGADSPGLRPLPDFQVRGEDGRRIVVNAEPVDPVKFTAKWILKPGESAVIGGYRLKIGTGEEREATFKPKYSSEFAIPDLRSGEGISLNVIFPYPKAPEDPNTYPSIASNELTFHVTDAKDVQVWATTGYGTWPMAGGVSLEVRGENFHAADMLTTAVLTWPDGKTAMFHVAADAFANREPWAIVWETGQAVLWIATGQLVPMGARDPAAAVAANALKRIDFNDPQRIEETYLNGWPREGTPSAECRAAMAKHLTVKADGEASSRAIHWVTENPARIWFNTLGISLAIDKGGESFRINQGAMPGDEQPASQPFAELEKALRAEAADKLAKWEDYKRTMSPAQREAIVDADNAKPNVTIFVPADAPLSSVNRAIKVCQAAGLGPNVTLRNTGENGASVRGVPLDGLPQSDDITEFADLYEPDPEHPEDVRKKRDVFFMSLGDVGPWLYYAANSEHYYLEVRPDPDVVQDVVYGPIPGDPVERLDLRGWLQDSPNHRDPGYARRVARDMISCGDNALARLAFEWLGDFAPPSPPDEHDEMIALLADYARDFPRSSAIGDATELREKLAAMAEVSRVEWEALRPQLPDEDYQPGVPYGDEHVDILWGEPSEAPLRLGIAGVTEGAHWRFGDTVSFDLYVCNESPDPVRFAWTPRIDEGLTVELVAPDGTVHRADIIRFSTLLFHNRSALESAHVLKVKSGATFTIGKPAGDGIGNQFPVEEGGKYTLRVSCHLGTPDWTDSKGTAHPRPAGEWEGTLQAKPLEVTLVAANAPAEPRHAGTASVLKKWREAYGDAEAIPAEARSWLADKVAAFIEQYPGTEGERMKAILPELKQDTPWPWSEAQTTLDALCDISTAPVGWLDLDESFRSFERVKPGEAWPAGKLAELPFGEPSDNGLRVAWIFDPMRSEYRVGDVLKCRIIFHNSGEEAVEFITDQWHQDDTWHVTDPGGEEIPTKGTWFTGLTPYQRYKLEPGQTCEVAGHGVGIGVAEFAEATSQAQVGKQILANPGDEVRCKWEVSLRAAWKQPDGTESEPATLSTGEVAFKVIAALPVGERPPGVAKSTGSFDLAQGIVLNVSQIGSDKGYDNLAWITWDQDNGAVENGKVDLTLPRNADPKDYSVPTFVWPRGGSALWIVQPDKLRRIDFSTVGEAKETNWNWDETPEDFGGAREDVREEITKQRPPAKEQSYLDRPLSEWDELLSSAVPSDRETLKALGYGTPEVAIPDAAVPMLLSLVKFGSPATKCRCLGTLRKLENPSEVVLDAVIAAMGDEKSPGNRHRAGYLLGEFRARSEYTVPRILPLLQKQGTVAQEAAVFALGQIGTKAKETLPALEALRPTASESLMKVIDSAIKGIRDSPPEENADAAGFEGLLILAIDADTDAPIESFRVLAGVPSGVSRGFEAEHNTTVINWQSHTIKLGKDGEFTWPADKGYDEMALRVEADGYVPQVIHGLKKGAREIINLELKRDPGIPGSVQTPGGQRAAHDATVVLAMIRRDARLKDSTFPELVLGEGGSLRDQWDRPTVVQPDGQGRFTLPDEPDPTAVVLILHGDGVFVQRFTEWKKAPDVTLEPWGRVHGRIQFRDTLGAGEKVHLIVNRGDDYGYPDIIAQYDDTTADETGQFVFERVLPGMAQLSSPIVVEEENGGTATVNLLGRTVHADIRAPHTPVLIGGQGRTLKGKLAGRDHWDGVSFHLHPTAPHVGFHGDDTMWKAWHDLQSSPLGPVFFRSGMKVEADGTFEIPGVLPGSYQIFFKRESEESHLASSQFSVPAEDRDLAPEPMDLGQIMTRTDSK